ncbi:MAG: 5-oxoprolinase subunit PxpA [Pseudomonadota bacterium]
MKRIDLNADLGEGYGPWRMGDDAALFRVVTSANVACGGHAGDPDVMRATVRLARSHNVTVGAHPGYADRTGFGRRIIPMSGDEITAMVAAQIGSLIGVAALEGVDVRYVKAHGALANLAADDAPTAEAVVRAIRAVSKDLAILAISGTTLEDVARAEGAEVYLEVFADRAYRDDGRLVSRCEAGAMITDPDAAAERLLTFLESGEMPTHAGRTIPLAAHSICVHGDSPEAVAMASRVRSTLEAAEITVATFIG